MEKCDRFRDLILTDYIDGELDKSSSRSIESHLLDCSDCCAFLKEVKNNAAIFPVSCPANVLRQPVPTELWETIKQSIEHKKQGSSPVEGFIEKLKTLIAFPRMVPVFASLILMLLAGSVTVNTIQVQRAQAIDQGEYLISLLGPTGPSALSDSSDLGTPIEHYFL